MLEKIRIFTYRIQPLMVIGLNTVVSQHRNYERGASLNEFSQLTEALSAPASDVTDILLTDFCEEFDLHPHLLSSLKQKNHNLKVLFFLPANTPETILVKALRAGGDGYSLQSATPDAFLNAVDTIASQRSYLEPQVTPTVLAELRKPAHVMLESDVEIELTPRERMLMQLAADGLTNAKIGQVLGIHEKTVRNLWSALFHKTGTSDRTQTVLWAIRTGQAELR